MNGSVALMENPQAALLKAKPRPAISDIKQQLRTSQRNLQIAARETKSSKSSEIEKNPFEEWNAIPQRTIHGLITSTPERFRLRLNENDASIGHLLNHAQAGFLEGAGLKPKMQPGVTIPRTVGITKIGSMVQCLGVVSRICLPYLATLLPRQV
jgi:hypothetical protein